MRRADLDKYIQKHGLLDEVENKPGIYAITVDDKIVYVGQSKWAHSRLSDHIYNIQNGMLVEDYKYKLLLAAKLGGHKIRFKILEYCEQEKLLEVEKQHISEHKPLLNVITPYGMQNIEMLKVEHLLGVEPPKGYLALVVQEV